MPNPLKASSNQKSHHWKDLPWKPVKPTSVEGGHTCSRSRAELASVRYASRFGFDHFLQLVRDLLPRRHQRVCVNLLLLLLHLPPPAPLCHLRLASLPPLILERSVMRLFADIDEQKKKKMPPGCFTVFFCFFFVPPACSLLPIDMFDRPCLALFPWQPHIKKNGCLL